MCLGRAHCQPEAFRFTACAMSDADKKARLREALRANLRKRKAQARGQTADAAHPADEQEQEPENGDGPGDPSPR